MKKNLAWWVVGALIFVASLPFALEYGIAGFIQQRIDASSSSTIHYSVNAVSCSLWQQTVSLEQVSIENILSQQSASAEKIVAKIPWHTIHSLLLPLNAARNNTTLLVASNAEISNALARDRTHTLRIDKLNITDLSLNQEQNLTRQAVGWAQLYAYNLEYSHTAMAGYSLAAQELQMLAWDGRRCNQANLIKPSVLDGKNTLFAAERLQAQHITLPPRAFWEEISKQNSPDTLLNALLTAPDPFVQQLILSQGRSITLIGGPHEIESINLDWPQSHPQQLHLTVQQYHFPAMDIALLTGFSLPELASISVTAQFTTTEKMLPEGTSNTQTLNIFSPDLARISLSLTLFSPNAAAGARQGIETAQLTDLNVNIQDLGFLPYMLGNCGGDADTFLKRYFNSAPQKTAEQKKFQQNMKLFLEQGGSIAFNLREAQPFNRVLAMAVNPAGFMQSTVSTANKAIAAQVAQLFGANAP
jgi:hypothetical protein